MNELNKDKNEWEGKTLEQKVESLNEEIVKLRSEVDSKVNGAGVIGIIIFLFILYQCSG